MADTLSADQAVALKTIGTWYRSKQSPYLTVGGYAGTGKSTLIAFVRKTLKINDPDCRVAFCGFTGKSVRVIESMLKRHRSVVKKDSISTIHSLIYHIETDHGGHITGWKLKPKIDFDLIMVDEASMVTQDIWVDLLSFKIPILAVGDHGQLPPVGGQFNLMQTPDIKLERIYRQQEDSPILTLATMARTTGRIPPGRYSDDVVKIDRSSDDIGVMMEELIENWMPDWLVLCGFNHTRVRLNQALRMRLGFASDEPVAGDHVICLKNNATSKLYNGMTGKITSIKRAEDEDAQSWYQCCIQFDDFEFEGIILRQQFNSKDQINGPHKTANGIRGDLFDFGYALTVHKAQGSSAETVLLFEERNRHMTDDDWRRWLYTAVTRAEKRLIIIGE